MTKHTTISEKLEQKTMNYYFEMSKKFHRRLIITLLSSLHNEIIMLKKYIKQESKYNITQLKSMDGLENLMLLAKNRKMWSILVKDVYDATKAEKNL